MSKEKILLVGGGTGGHASPILAVYQELKKAKPDVDIYVVGNGNVEERIFFETLPKYLTITTGKKTFSFFQNVIEAFKYLNGLRQASKILKKVKPTIIFSKGGFVSMPVIERAKSMNISYLLHESDIVMGKVNSKMAQKAEKVFVMYPGDCYPEISKEKIIQTGPLLREDKTTNKENLFGFVDKKPVIFLTGGSQGSLKLSEVLLQILKDLLGKYNVIHQAGKHSIKIAKEFESTLTPQERSGYYLIETLKTVDGVDMMQEAMKQADLVISRAGSTIAELAVKGKPMILVPWKCAAQNHQQKNAEFFEKNQSAILISEDSLTPEILKVTIEGLFSDDGRKLAELRENEKKLFPSNGAQMVAKKILKHIEEK